MKDFINLKKPINMSTFKNIVIFFLNDRILETAADVLAAGVIVGFVTLALLML